MVALLSDQRAFAINIVSKISENKKKFDKNVYKKSRTLKINFWKSNNP